MKAKVKLVLMLCSPLLMAALWMDHQPSYKPYRAPVLSAPPGSVPVSGRESGEQKSGLVNPVPADSRSLALGKELFEINCAMCHGESSAKRGPVGRKFTPEPPPLDQGMVRLLDDSRIYNAISNGFGRMPPFGNRLSSAERWSLVNFLRTRK